MDIEKIRIRNLRAEEIDCRVGSITEKGVSILLYKNARVDQAILDEAFGVFGWQRRHELIGNQMFCMISVWDEKKQAWIQKEDVGTAGDFEPAKSAASDSFKRAAGNWGIGRELYSSPRIFLSADKVCMGEKNGKRYVKDSFFVRAIKTSEDKMILDLEIVNQNGFVVFRYHKPGESSKFTEEEIQFLYDELERTGVKQDSILKRYKINSFAEMDRDTYKRAISGLKRSKNAA